MTLLVITIRSVRIFVRRVESPATKRVCWSWLDFCLFVQFLPIPAMLSGKQPLPLLRHFTHCKYGYTSYNEFQYYQDSRAVPKMQSDSFPRSPFLYLSNGLLVSIPCPQTQMDQTSLVSVIPGRGGNNSSTFIVRGRKWIERFLMLVVRRRRG